MTVVLAGPDTRTSWPAAPAGRAALSDVDPDLAGSISGERGAGVRQATSVAVYRLQRGALPEPPARVDGEPHYGFLVLKGLLLREVTTCGRPTAELLGPGDLIHPWSGEQSELLNCDVRYTVLEQALLADLDRGFATRVVAYPEIIEQLISRSAARAKALALQRSIAAHVRVDVRVLAFLWHLAERFGVVVPDAVRVEVPLTHSVLARLVGARRPTVTTALQRLIQLGYLRRDDGAFVLTGTANAVEELDARSPSREFAPAETNGQPETNGRPVGAQV